MKLSTIFSALIAISLCLASCGDNGGATGSATKSDNKALDYDAMAQELCTCMTPLSDLYKKVMVASEAQDTAKMATLVGDFERLSKEGEACATKLEQKYGNMDDPNITEKARAAVEKACPEIAAMMAGGAATQ